MSDAIEAVRPSEMSLGPAPESAKLRQILEGAWPVFMRDGFDAASMNDIARAAGVSKGTLYVYFSSKEALFEALIRRGREQQAERFMQLDDLGGPLAGSLQSIGRALLSMLLHPEHTAHFRIVTAAAAKVPRVGAVYYEAGPCHGANRLSSFLIPFMAGGQLRDADPRAAAVDFINLCQGYLFKEVMFGVRDRATEAEIDATVDHAVDTFMRAYAPTTDAGTGASASRSPSAM